MNAHVRNFENAATGQVNDIAASSQVIGGQLASFFEENIAFSRRSLEDTTAFLKKLMGQQTLQDAAELQSDFVRGQSTAFLEQCRKVTSLCHEMAEEAMKPVRTAASRASVAAS